MVDATDLVSTATVQSSSTLKLAELTASEGWTPLDFSWAMLLPLHQGACPKFTFELDVKQSTMLTVELRRASSPSHFTLDELIEVMEVKLSQGIAPLEVVFQSAIEREGYHFIKWA